MTVGIILLACGMFFACVGVIGLFRFRDTYARTKALALVNLPAAVCIHVASSLLVPGKGQRGLVTALLFVLTGPVLTYVILFAARRSDHVSGVRK